jgi:hypothetical protein
MSNVSNREEMERLAQVVNSLELLFGRRQLAVWRIEGERVSPVYGLVATDGSARGTVPRVCRQRAAELAAGQVVRTADSTLLPLINNGLLGVVHVAGKHTNLPNRLVPMVRSAIRTLARILAGPDETQAELESLTLHAPADDRETVAARIDAELDAAQRQIQDMQRNRLIYRLSGNAWNVSETARQLGLSRGSLWLRMRALDIRRPAPAPTDPRASRSTPDPDPDDFPRTGSLEPT